MAINAFNWASDNLCSTVRNISDVSRFFAFLPPHGRRLAAGEQITVFGDIQHTFTKATPNERYRRSFEAALSGDTPVMALVKTPAVHLFDPTLDTTKVLSLDNSVLADVDPSWGSYTSVAE